MVRHRTQHMVKMRLAALALLAGTAPAYADAPLAPPSVLSMSQIQALPLAKPSGTEAATEIAPALLPGPNGMRLIYLATAFTYLCGTTFNPLQAPVVLDASQCAVVDVPETQSSPHRYLAPAQLPTASHQWKLEYDAVFSAQITHDSVTNTNLIITINHNEVKNETVPDAYRYQSPFAPQAAILPANCGYAGYTGRGPSGYQTCWLAYGAFVSLETNEMSAKTNYGRVLNQSEIGPVIWPTAGYFDLSRGIGGKLSSGLRHPSAIISNGYLYIYYLDTSKGSIGGLSIEGTKVARAQISARGLPGSFMVWDGHAFAAPALPAGFDKNNMRAFIARPGPQVPSLFAEQAARQSDYSLQSTHFSVGYDQRRHLYLGVEAFIDHADTGRAVHRVALRQSSDLVHWSDRTQLAINGKQLAYPEFANADFTSNNDIDMDNLYIVGTKGGQVTYVRLSVR